MSIKSIVTELKEAAGYEVEVHRYLDQLIRLLDDLVTRPDTHKDSLSEIDIQAIRGFRLTAHKAGSMSPSMIKKHVLAYWRHAKEGILRLDRGQEVARIVKNIGAVSVPHNEG
jgi:hypothetical protein